MLPRMKSWIDLCTEIVSGIGLIVMFLLLLIQVILRYFDNPLFWVEEVALLLQIWVVFLGVSIVLRKGGHPSLILLQRALSSTSFKLPLEFVIYGLMGILGGAMFYYGIQLAEETWSVKSPALGISRGVFILPVSLGGALIVIEVFYQFFKFLNKD
ncbi:TRAP transporter small permease [Ammoniphilus resinae]|nr:TRAP transporter small permease [Ammoniphilus resinae]